MALTSQTLRILLVEHDQDQVQWIKRALAASATPRFLVDHAADGWEAQRQAVAGAYEALVLESTLVDTDCETLLSRLRAVGISAPALVLTSTGVDTVAAAGDDYVSKEDALHGSTLTRAIVSMVQRRDLTHELAAARDEIARASTVLRDLAHDLATPLGIVMGMTQLMLRDDNGLNAGGRACLEDVESEALRACAILERLNSAEVGDHRPSAPLIAHAPTLGPATSSGPESRMVLIADDDAATRRLVIATLASNQYSVLQAADGREAWRLIRQHHPAVAILDWQMPVYTGLELTDVIKGDPQVRSMTVIMLTGRNTQADREAGKRAQADLYLTKPFSPQELLGAVEQALGIR